MGMGSQRNWHGHVKLSGLADSTAPAPPPMETFTTLLCSVYFKTGKAWCVLTGVKRVLFTWTSITIFGATDVSKLLRIMTLNNTGSFMIFSHGKCKNLYLTFETDIRDHMDASSLIHLRWPSLLSFHFSIDSFQIQKKKRNGAHVFFYVTKVKIQFQGPELSWKSVETYTLRGFKDLLQIRGMQKTTDAAFSFYPHNSDGFDDDFHLVLSEQ